MVAQVFLVDWPLMTSLIQRAPIRAVMVGTEVGAEGQMREAACPSGILHTDTQGIIDLLNKERQEDGCGCYGLSRHVCKHSG